MQKLKEFVQIRRSNSLRMTNCPRPESNSPHRYALAIGCYLVAIMSGCDRQQKPEIPVARDEAKLRAEMEGLSNQQAAFEYFYPRKIDDYFKGMDPVVTLSKPDQLLDLRAVENKTKAEVLVREPSPVIPLELHDDYPNNEVLGRNTWMIWCGGNEGFWDWLANDNLGFIDLLKVVDSRERITRFKTGGLINEPNMVQAREPDQFGLWLDLPADGLTRDVRQAYIAKTFGQLATGNDKSQRHLEYDPENPGRKYEPVPYDSVISYVTGLSNGYQSPTATGNQQDAAGNDPYGAIPPPDIYGLSSGVVGLRLFPNPKFDDTARKKWDATRYYRDPDYYNDPQLVRPYRVGMSCAFCHASWSPLSPPRDLTNPEWENISGNIGAQYLRVRAVLGNLLKEDDFVYHLLDSQPPGTIDTSLIASDNINNPNTMNAVFRLKERAIQSFHNPKEDQGSASSGLPSIWADPLPIRANQTGGNSDYGKAAGKQSYDGTKQPGYSIPPDRIPGKLYDELVKLLPAAEIADSNGDPRRTPRVLLDGSDSIGPFGALARVYLNIGSYYERWNQLHQPLLGFTPQQPFRIKDCEENSVYWHATKLRVGPMRDYFLVGSTAMPLLATDEADKRLWGQSIAKPDPVYTGKATNPTKMVMQALNVNVDSLQPGRLVFAKNCIVCHSGIQPESSVVYPELDAVMKDDFADLIARRKRSREAAAVQGEFFENDPGQWLRDAKYLEWAKKVVEVEAFWQNNYLSSDYRIPINLVKTNAGRAMATNALDGHMWQDFSSDSYRRLPSPGSIEYYNPYDRDSPQSMFTPRHRVPTNERGEPVTAAGGGGVGYYRVPTLVSIWATAPLLHNNSLGLFNNDPSVDGRLLAFDDAMRKLLWPEKRRESSCYNGATPKRLNDDHGLIWRTTADSKLVVRGKYVPNIARRLPLIAELKSRLGFLDGVFPLWLPSAVLFLTGFLVLCVANDERRQWASIGMFLAAALLTVAWLLSDSVGFLGWFGEIYPIWLPVGVLVICGFNLLLPLAPNHMRNLGYGFLIAAAVLALAWSLVPSGTWLEQIQPFWLLIAGLITGGLSVLLFRITQVWRRIVGYLSVVAALAIGFFISFDEGRLGDLSIGPIPKGTPVNLLANFNPEADPKTIKSALTATIDGLARIKSQKLGDDDARKVMLNEIAPALLSVNKCPDFVMDGGHYFPWFESMTDEEKNALIELLKTF